MLLLPQPKLHALTITDLCGYYYEIAGLKQYVSPSALANESM